MHAYRAMEDFKSLTQMYKYLQPRLLEQNLFWEIFIEQNCLGQYA
jgi:hypothetical protein